MNSIIHEGPLCGHWWLFTTDPLVSVSVFIAELMTGRQACRRVIALSRRDQDRESIRVLPRWLALPHWPLPPLWGFWISAKKSISSDLKFFLCSACTLMLRSPPRIRFPLGFLKWEPAPLSFLVCPWLQLKSKA